MTHAAIINRRLVLVSAGGSVTGLGIRACRAAIKRIEASPRDLADSTKTILDVYRRGVVIWENRK